ncbi:MAG: hypothetical protein ABL949_14105 [Fimbriimonadaceae bacterium]
MYAILALAITQAPTCVCPVTGQAVNDESPSFAVSGVQFRFADESSKNLFAKSPLETLEVARKKGWTVGISFFDPVTHKSPILSRDGKIRAADLNMIKAFSTYNGVIFPFERPRSKNQFERDPASWLAEPKQYTLACPYMGNKSPSVERAVGYQDVEGVRYFLCCDTCVSFARGQGKNADYSESKKSGSDWVSLFPKK